MRTRPLKGLAAAIAVVALTAAGTWRLTARAYAPGLLVREPRRWLFYYGAADTHVGVASVTR